MPRPEEVCDLVDGVDEGERPQTGEMSGHGMGELEGESGERRHRARDVAEEPYFGAMGARMPELGICRHSPGRQGLAYGAPEVETAVTP